MPTFKGTIVTHTFKEYEFEGDNFDLAKDHLDYLVANYAIDNFDTVYEETQIVGLNMESSF